MADSYRYRCCGDPPGTGCERFATHVATERGVRRRPSQWFVCEEHGGNALLTSLPLWRVQCQTLFRARDAMTPPPKVGARA